MKEGEDFYFEDGFMVLTAKFLLDRGYCCNNDCRHCPYPKSVDAKASPQDKSSAETGNQIIPSKKP